MPTIAHGPVTGSLCTGYGGLDAAVSAVFGGRLAWAADPDPGCRKIIGHRMPGVPNLGDIREVDWAAAEPVDILSAGFPCQPVSGAGKQKGVDDERWLWPAIAQAVGRMVARPRLLVLENVPRLLTVSGGSAMAQVVYSLAALGYVGRYGLYRADWAGAPHKRERWFCLAWQAAPHPGREPGLQWRWPDGQQEAGGGPLGISRGSGDRANSGSLTLPPAPDATHGRIATRTAPLRAGEVLSLLQTPSVADGTGGRLTRSGARSNELLLKGQAVRLAFGWQEFESAVRRWEASRGPAPHPVETGQNGKPRMAAALPEWMMGLPPGWVTGVPGLSRSAMLKAIGNGVVPQQAAMAIRDLAGPPDG